MTGVSSFGYSGTIAHALARRAQPIGSINPLCLGGLRAPAAFRRRRFAWGEAAHPLRQHHWPAADAATLSFRSPADGVLAALVADHRVRGRVVFPAAAHLEMARAVCCGDAAGGASSTRATLRQGVSVQPLPLDEPLGLWVGCAVVEDAMATEAVARVRAAAARVRTAEATEAAATLPEGWRRTCYHMRSSHIARAAGAPRADCVARTGESPRVAVAPAPTPRVLPLSCSSAIRGVAPRCPPSQ